HLGEVHELRGVLLPVRTPLEAGREGSRHGLLYPARAEICEPLAGSTRCAGWLGQSGPYPAARLGQLWRCRPLLAGGSRESPRQLVLATAWPRGRGERRPGQVRDRLGFLCGKRIMGWARACLEAAA